MRYTHVKLGILLLGLAFATTCGGGGGSGISNGLSKTFPSDLTVTSPYSQLSTASSMVIAHPQFDKPPDEFKPKPPEEMKDDIKDMLNGKTEGCGFNVMIFAQGPQATCYGPTIDYTNHPHDGSSGNLPPNDLGIWEATQGSTGEACVATKFNEIIGNISKQVDTAVNAFASMLCAAKAEGQDALPGAGETKDFTDVLKSKLEGVKVPFTVTEAKIERAADSSDGYPTYLSTIKATISKPDGNTLNFELNLKHIPMNDTNTEYKGKLWYKIGSETTDFDAGHRLMAVSILYKKVGDDLTYRLKSGQFGNYTDPAFDSRNNVDPEGNWQNNFHDISIKMGKDAGGAFVSRWQAGHGDGWTRTMAGSLAKGSDGKLAGCGYYGFGPDMAVPSGTNYGKITGFICAWTGPGSHMDGAPAHALNLQDKVQKQCVQQDATKGLFVPSESNIDYAPLVTPQDDPAGVCSDTSGAFGKASITDNLPKLSVETSNITYPADPEDIDAL